MREELVRVARAAEERGLNRATSGNVSVRAEGGMLITPTAVPCSELAAGDLVFVAADGTAPEDGTPSTEWRLHRRLYRARRDARAVLHAHPPFCTALACLRREIPAVHYLVAAAGGHTIPCAPYAPFGSEELARAATDALEGRLACLMANHGMVALGDSPRGALERATRVEAVAEVYWRALQAGEPSVLPEEEMAEVRERLAAYGDP